MKKAIFAIAVICSAAVRAEPLTEFQDIVKQCKKLVEQDVPRTLVENRKNAGYWVKLVLGPASIAYDVRKTDSLVSPLVAHIEVTSDSYGSPASTEEEAKALSVNLDGAVNRSTHRINYAYQDGAWQLVSGLFIETERKEKDGPFTEWNRSKKSRDELLQKPTKDPIANCYGLTK